MARFAVEINTENAAFDGAIRNCEIARILTDIAKKVGRGKVEGAAWDVNGNPVGWFALKDADEEDGGEA